VLLDAAPLLTGVWAVVNHIVKQTGKGLRIIITTEAFLKEKRYR